MNVDVPLAPGAGVYDSVPVRSVTRAVSAGMGASPSVPVSQFCAIASGAIGELAYMDAVRINLGPPASEVDVLWDLAPHDISILISLAGRAPESVTAFAASYVRDGMIDSAYLHLEFPGRRMGHIHVSWLSPHKTRRLWVMGTRGSILYDDTAADKVRIFDEGFDSRIGAGADDAREGVPGATQVRELLLVIFHLRLEKVHLRRQLPQEPRRIVGG